MAEDHAPDDRATYEPASQKSQVRQQFRPTSAPRQAARSDTKSPRNNAYHDDSGPVVEALQPIQSQRRPTSAPSRPLDVLDSAPAHPPYILESCLEFRPMSAGTRHHRFAQQHADVRLPASGALAFMEPGAFRAPMRVFAPMASPQTSKTRFQPTWALSNHRQKEREMLAEASLQSALSYEGSRHGSAGWHRSAGSVASSQISSHRPGSEGGQRNTSAGSHPDIPRTTVRNPLAQKNGGSTGDLYEYNGSFLPLKSQSKIPDYEALYDPHLKGFWGRSDVAKVMKLEGKTRDLWAPDSGMLEAAISSELTKLSRNRDIADVLAPLEPLIPALGVDPPDMFPGMPTADVMSIEVSEEAVSIASETIPLSLKQPVISAWLHWGSQAGQGSAADLDLSAVCFDNKARVLETVFYRHLVSRHEVCRYVYLYTYIYMYVH